jgi:hypothetical protein
MHILKKKDNNRVVKNRFDNYLIPPKNNHLMHIKLKLYTKCPFQDFKSC